MFRVSLMQCICRSGLNPLKPCLVTPARAIRFRCIHSDTHCHEVIRSLRQPLDTKINELNIKIQLVPRSKPSISVIMLYRKVPLFEEPCKKHTGTLRTESILFERSTLWQMKCPLALKGSFQTSIRQDTLSVFSPF